VPDRATIIRRGDRLLIVVPSKYRQATQERIHAVSEDGRLAGWNHQRQTDSDERSPSQERIDRYLERLAALRALRAKR
jgi:cell volume regulation protein A